MNIWATFFAAIGGATIASLASIITIIVQNRFEREREIRQMAFENRRDRTRLATEAGIEDYKQAIGVAQKRGGRSTMTPLSIYIYYHSKILDLIGKGQLTAETFQEANNEMMEIRKVAE